MKYALVTGGSRGIGRAISKQLAADGYAVIVNYVANKVAAKDTCQSITDNGGKAELLQCDLSHPEAIETAIEQWQNEHPDEYISVLVNSAGIRDDSLMIFMQDEQWHRVLDTTLNGFFYLTRRLLKDMLTHRQGRIINVSSLSGLKGLPGQVNYSAAKGAIISATRALAQEVGARKVTVNAVCPGFIATDMTKDLPADELSKMVPIRRFGTPEEVAYLVSFLASEKAAYITGQAISINGGLY